MKNRLIRCALLATLALGSCTTVSVTCPDGKSTIAYKGTNLISTAPTSVSCGSNGSTTTASVSGTDLSTLAQAIAPYLANSSAAATSAPAAAK